MKRAEKGFSPLLPHSVVVFVRVRKHFVAGGTRQNAGLLRIYPAKFAQNGELSKQKSPMTENSAMGHFVNSVVANDCTRLDVGTQRWVAETARLGAAFPTLSEIRREGDQ